MVTLNVRRHPATRTVSPPRRSLRILLSAYACEPYRGSEPGIGWQWATRLAEAGHEIVVITRSNNAAVIARALQERPIPKLHFVYFDLPKSLSFWKRGGRGVHLYYFLWQCATYRIARRLHRQQRFDVVHHLTFGVFRQPSWLAFLDAPFVFGPVGGGERAPRSLRQGLPLMARIREAARDMANAYAAMDPLLRIALRRAKTILCKTEETRHYIPPSLQSRCELFLEIGTERPPARVNVTPNTQRKSLRALRVLYVGRLVYLKGLHLALPAFAKLCRDFPESRFTIVGSGPQEAELRALASRLKLDDHIEWVSWLPHDEVLSIYGKNDVFLFPSFHDSSGNAVLEAMTHGLPVICLKLGGPAAIVDAFSGIRVDAKDPNEAIQHLGSALSLLAGNPMLHSFLSRGAYARANNYFSWHAQIERMTSLYYGLLTHA